MSNDRRPSCLGYIIITAIWELQKTIIRIPSLKVTGSLSWLKWCWTLGAERFFYWFIVGFALILRLLTHSNGPCKENTQKVNLEVSHKTTFGNLSRSTSSSRGNPHFPPHGCLNIFSPVAGWPKDIWAVISSPRLAGLDRGWNYTTQLYTVGVIIYHYKDPY